MVSGGKQQRGDVVECEGGRDEHRRKPERDLDNAAGDRARAGSILGAGPPRLPVDEIEAVAENARRPGDEERLVGRERRQIAGRDATNAPRLNGMSGRCSTREAASAPRMPPTATGRASTSARSDASTSVVADVMPASAGRDISCRSRFPCRNLIAQYHAVCSNYRVKRILRCAITLREGPAAAEPGGRAAIWRLCYYEKVGLLPEPPRTAVGYHTT